MRTLQEDDQVKLALETTVILPDLLKQLFDRLRLPVAGGALEQACRTAQPEGATLHPGKRVAMILNHLQIRGLQAAALRFARFDQRRLPVLIFQQGEWFLLERRDKTLWMTNAAGLASQADEEELQSAMVLWFNTPAIGTDKGNFSKDNPARDLVLRELFRNKRWFFDVVIATLVINALAISTSIFAMQVYDRVVPTLAYATLWTLVGGMGIILILDWLLKTVRARILDSLSCAVDKSVSQEVFEHVLNLQLDTRPRSLGTMAAQVGGLDSVRQFFSSAVVFALVDMPFALMFIVFIGIIGGKVGWVYLSLLPVAACLGLVSQLRLRRLVRQQIIRSNERQGLLVDCIRGVDSIRASNAAWRFAQEWQMITQTIARYNVRQKALSSLTTVSTSTLSSLAYVCAVVVGVQQIEAGALSMGGLIACSILGGRVIAPIAQSVQYLVQWQNVSQALQMVNQILLLPRERPNGQTLLMPDTPPEKIEIEGVRFSYPNSPVTQLNIPKLTISAGERVALIGPVGSGKSTLLQVLSGMYKPSEGRVKLGLADLWEIAPSIVADQIGYLPQTVHLFKGTLRSNLTLSGAVRDSDVLEICNQLGIDKIVADSPRGLDLEITEGGQGLSGGQRQLVGLARVFLARPKIWLLDEPAASLDSDTEATVMAALEKYVQPSDILLISTHKPLLAARLVKRMIVMQQGEIVDDGSPEAVISRLQMGRQPKVVAFGSQHGSPIGAGLPATQRQQQGVSHVI